MKTLFLDMAGMAKSQSLTEAQFRTMVLSGFFDAYVFVCARFEGTQHEGEFLPPYDHHVFPDVRWEDFGSPFDASGTCDHGTRSFSGKSSSPSRPSYRVNGWVRISQEIAAIVLTQGHIKLNGNWVAIDETDSRCFGVRCAPEQSWNSDQGFHDEVVIKIEPQDLVFMPLEVERSHVEPLKGVDIRREKSLLRIVRALDVMAKLPRRGAAASIEMQIRELGFDGPNDDTIRGVIEEARALKADPPKT